MPRRCNEEARRADKSSATETKQLKTPPAANRPPPAPLSSTARPARTKRGTGKTTSSGGGPKVHRVSSKLNGQKLPRPLSTNLVIRERTRPAQDGGRTFYARAARGVGLCFSGSWHRGAKVGAVICGPGSPRRRERLSVRSLRHDRGGGGRRRAPRSRVCCRLKISPLAPCYSRERYHIYLVS